MKFRKKIAILVILLIGVFLIFITWYRHKYSMEVTNSYEVNATDFDRKLLIAMQGSEFKDSVVAEITRYYRTQPIFIQVIDISLLENTNTADFDAILMLHTWEYGKPPKAIQSFMDKKQVLKNKLVVLTTSGEGTEKMEGVDAITGESIISDVSLFVDNVLARLNPLLEVRN